VLLRRDAPATAATPDGVATVGGLAELDWT
jgi:hypothetical protein